MSSNQAGEYGGKIGAIRQGANARSDMFFSVTNDGGTLIERMRITKDGSVGIGSTSPASTLGVAGSGYFAGNLNLDQFSKYQLNGLTVLSATTTTFNTLAGFYAGANIVSTSTSNTSGLYNTALGYEALRYATSTDYNTAVGYQALRMSSSGTANNSGSYNSALGRSALFSNTTGIYNSALGVNALYSNTTGSNNSALGVNALYSNTTGSNNSAFGYFALYSNTTGSQNSALGRDVLFSNTTGANNSALGNYALYSNTTGSYNSALGYQALYYNASATNTVAVGYQAAQGTALYNNQGGTYLGYQAGYSAGTGSNYNTLLGYQAGYGITTGAYNIVIGQNVEAPTVTGNQQLNIGNVLYGSGIYNGSSVSAAPVLNSKLGVGTTTPFAKLSIHAFNGETNTALFAVASSTASATSTLFVINNNGNVGVGTTSPSQLLSIAGNTYLTGGLGVGRATTTAGNIETSGILSIQGTGTSSFANGINLATGCYSITGSCLVTGVSSVSNSDGTLTISPTSGSVVAGLNLASSNLWTASTTILNLSSVLSTSTNATTTGTQNVGALRINSQHFTNLLGSGLVNTAGVLTPDCATITGGAGLCDGVDADSGAGTGSNWLFESQFAIRPTSTAVGILTSASSTLDRLFSRFATTTEATSTNFHISPTGYLTIPQGTAPVMGTAGQIALDTTDNQFLIATSTNNDPIVIPSKSGLRFRISSTSAPFFNGFSTGKLIGLPSEPDGYSAISITCSVWGGTSIVVNLTDASENDTNTATCGTATSTTVMNSNSTFTALEGANLETGTVTGTPDFLYINISRIWVRE